MSYAVCTNFNRRNNCPACLEELKNSRNVLVHKDASGKNTCPIHANCLQELLKASLDNTNTPPKCPLCREQITHVKGKPLQRVQQRMLPASLDPLSADAINQNEQQLELDYRVRENSRLLSRRVFQSLIPGRVESLSRHQLIPEHNLSQIAANDTLMNRNMVYATTSCLSILTIGLCISMHSSPDDYSKSLILGTAAAIVGSLAARSLRNLHQTIQTLGPFLFLTETDQEHPI
jgi:hypothetical protein